MQNRFAAYAPVVFWVGVVVLIFGVILTVGGGRGPIPTPYMLVGGAALVVLSGLLNITASRRLMGQRSVRYGSNALVMTLAFLAILGLINFVGTRRTWRQDFTANQQFSLSLQTIRILEGLKQPVKATAFYTPDIPTQEAQDRLKEYALHSAQFTYEFVNPNEHPETAIKLGATRAGGIVFESGGKKQEATAVTESDFTGAILKVTSDKPRVVVFLTGHKERDLNGFGDDGYSTMRASLEKDNYSVSTQSLLISNTIPLSATVVVLAGPQSALSDSESQTLSNYLDQGGHLLVMADILQPAPIPDLLAKWGVKFDNDYVVDPASYIQGTTPLAPAVAQYSFSSITQQMSGLISVFPLVRSIKTVENAPTNPSPQEIAQSSPNSWGETNLDLQTQARFDDGKDFAGPLDLMMTVEATAPISATAADASSARKTRLVLVGTSELVSNVTLQRIRGAANLDLFLNAVNWLAEEESLISIRPVAPDQRLVVMTEDQRRLVFLLTVILVPGLVLVTGFSVWWRRR